MAFIRPLGAPEPPANTGIPTPEQIAALAALLACTSPDPAKAAAACSDCSPGSTKFQALVAALKALPEDKRQTVIDGAAKPEMGCVGPILQAAVKEAWSKPPESASHTGMYVALGGVAVLALVGIVIAAKRG